MSAPSFVLQNAGTTQQLNHVYGFGPTLVVAVGNGGTIVTWNGQQWQRQQSGTQQDLLRVWGATASPGSTAAFWAVGRYGTMLYSGDGGAKNWQPVSTLQNAIAAASSPSAAAFTAIWGSSPTDIWAIDDNLGNFWHTADGAKSWTGPLNQLSFLGWRSMQGDGANFIVAVANTVAQGSIYAYIQGSSWAMFSPDVQSSFNKARDAWPHAGSSQAWLVGYNPTGPRFGPTGAAISNWPAQIPNLAAAGANFDTLPSGAQQLNAVYGADTTNLFTVGVGFTSQPLAYQIAAPHAPGVTSSWLAVPMPAAMPPGGLNAVYAGPSGYAVVVGAAGAIAATPGFLLAIQDATAIATNTVQVRLTNIPLMQSAIGDGDALNPASWTLSRLDTGKTLTPLAVIPIGPQTFNVVIAERLGPASVQHQVGAALLDPFGNPMTSPTAATLYGCLADSQATQGAMAAANNYAVSDLANPPFPPIGQNSGGGTRVINAAGDFASVSGNELLRKLIVRRISTSTNGFFHLPGYGLGLDPKSPVRASDLIALRKRVQQQIELEPEVVSATVALDLDEVNGVLTISGTALTAQGQTLPFQTTVQAGAGS